MLALLAAMAMAQGSPDKIRTSHEYAQCLQKASKEVALEYKSVDSAVPLIIARCETIWDRWKQETLRRHPDDADTIARLESRMREQVREIYANNSIIHQKRELMQDMAKSAEEASRMETANQMMELFILCQVEAAEKAAEQHMDPDAIGDHVDQECEDREAEAVKRLPAAIDATAVAVGGATEAQFEAAKRQAVKKMLAGMRAHARKAYAPAIEKAKRWESCIANGHEPARCALGEQVVEATGAYEQCVGKSARRSAQDGDSFDAALADVDKTCTEQFAAAQQLSTQFGHSDAQWTQYLRKVRALLQGEYPKFLEQAENAGGAQ